MSVSERVCVCVCGRALTPPPPPPPPEWSEEACAAHLTQRDGYHASTQGQLKDQLYQQIINYFDKGKVRERGRRPAVSTHAPPTRRRSARPPTQRTCSRYSAQNTIQTLADFIPTAHTLTQII